MVASSASVTPTSTDPRPPDRSSVLIGSTSGGGGRSGRVRRIGPRRPWQAILLSPEGDGRRRRRGTDGARLTVAVLGILACWGATRAGSHAEHVVATILASPPDGIRWLVTALWWAASAGLIGVVVLLAALGRRWVALRDVALSALASWGLCVVAIELFGLHGGRPPDPSLHGFDLTFPAVRVAVAVAVATAALPSMARWMQRTIDAAAVLLAVTTVVSRNGLPVAVLAGALAGWGITALVRLVFGSPLGLPSAAEVTQLLASLDLTVDEVAASPVQHWGVARYSGRLDGADLDVSVYGRDASDAQLLSKTIRFLFYRDSGPTLALTRRQQVEHEAFLTLMAARAGARVPEVLAAGPAGPAHDAVLVSRPPRGRRLSGMVRCADTDGTGPSGDEQGDVLGVGQDGNGHAVRPIGDAVALDDLFIQIMRLREARIAHGAISPETVIVDDLEGSGLLDFHMASVAADPEQLDRDLAAALATAALVVDVGEAVAAAARVVPPSTLAGALPFLQRAALGSEAQRALRGHRALLSSLRSEGAAAADVDVPKLIEPRRISWINLLLVVGTLVGGWALIGVLVNVTKSWSTITGARWGWVAAVAVLSQVAYPAVATTTVGSVTDPLPFGRTWALEVADTFVALAGGSMAVLATRVRYFQQEGYDSTLAVSSGVLVSTASWIVKGGLFLVSLPFALGQLHFTRNPSGSGSSGGHAKLVWLIVLAVIGGGLVLGAVFAVPRWRRMAAEKLRPKVSEVWSHLRVLATHPRNLVEIFGGSVAAQLLVAMALGAALHAFGDHLSLAVIIVVLTLGSMLGGVSPVPGGMGVVEAGMIFGLTAAGIGESVAVAAVFVQRLFTAYLPPIWGWFTLVWMRRREYL